MKKRRNRLFRSVQRTILYLALLVTSLSCVLFYSVSRQALLDRTCRADVKYLHQVSSAADSMKQTVGTIGWQVFNDQLVAYLLYADFFDSSSLCAAFAQLNNYRSSNPYVESIYLYNGNRNSVSVSSSRFGTYDAPLTGKNAFFDSQISDFIRGGGFDRRYQPVPRVVSYQDQSYFYYTYLTCDTFGEQDMQSAVFVNFSGEWLDSIMQNREEASLGDTLILSGEGDVVSGGGRFQMLTDVSHMDFYSRLQARSGEGYFVAEIDGEKTLVSYLRPDDESWQYVRLTDYRLITEEIDQAITNLLVIGLVIIGVGALGSYLFSQRVRKPIGEMYRNLERLEQESWKSGRSHRRQLLQNLLYGSEKPESLVETGVLDGLHLREEGRQCLLVLIRIRNYRGLYQSYDSDDRSLIRYAVANVATEICARGFCADAVDMGGGNRLALILTLPDGEEPDRLTERIEACLREVTSSVREALSLELSYTASEQFPFRKIAAVYRVTQEAAGHQLFCRAGDVLWARQTLEKNARHYVYPQDREEQMVELVLSSRETEACAVMRGIILETEEYSFSVVSLVVSRITLSLQGVIEDLKNHHLLELPDSAAVEFYPVTRLDEAESIEAVVGSFEKMIRWIASSLEDKRNAHHSLIVQKITQLIQDTFRNPECCLDSVAEAVGLSSAYAGKLYKRYTLKSVAESINERRMEEARRLLLERRKLTIAEIAAGTGFSSNSYFSKAFRKENGMTPNEYRNLNRPDGA